MLMATVSIEQKYNTEIRGELHDAQKLKEELIRNKIIKEELIRNKIIKDIILELKLKYSTDRYTQGGRNAVDWL